MITQADFAFVAPLEKFVLRLGGMWNTSAPIGRIGLRSCLIASGWAVYDVDQMLKAAQYQTVLGWDRKPNAGPIYLRGGLTDCAYLNIWVPGEVVPSPGPYPTIQAAMGWFTGTEPTAATWLTSWIAQKLQNPMLNPKLAVVLASQPGAGKNFLGTVLKLILGPENCAEITQGQLSSQFNARWADKFLVIANEVVSRENLRDISNELKVLIDSPEIEIQAKHRNQVVVPNRLAFLFTSNDIIAPVAIERGDRRYSVFVNHTVVPTEHRAAMDACFEPTDKSSPTPAFRAEIAGFYAAMLATEVDHSLVSRPYDNSARRAMISAASESHQEFFAIVSAGGLDDLIETVVATGDWTLATTRANWDFGTDGISNDMLYQCYRAFCSRRGQRPLGHAKLITALGNYTPPNGQKWEPFRKYVTAAAGVGRNVYVYAHAVPRSALTLTKVSA